MANKFVSVAGGGDGSSTSSRWTVAQANAGLVAGDIARMAAGTYTTDILPANSGSAGNPITYLAEAAGVLFSDAKADLDDKSYITLDGIEFFSDGGSWVDTTALSSHITLENCTFDSDDPAGGPWGAGNAAVGLTLLGDNVTIRNCHFTKWLGVDMARLDGDYALVEGNYIGHSGHGSFHLNGNFFVFKNNECRNKWARAGNFAPDSSETGDITDGVIDDNVFFDNNLIDVLSNEGEEPQGWLVNVSGDTPGDEQAVGKAGGSRLRVRGNLIIRNHTGPLASTTYRADFQIGNYALSPYWRQMRACHNTHFDGELHPWSITYNNDTTYHAQDNRFLNNVWYPIATDRHGTNNVGFWFNVTGVSASDVGQTPYTFMDTGWQFRNNVNPRGFRYGGATGVITNATFAGMFPTQVSGNISSAPVFVNDDYSAAVADIALMPTRANFRLAAGSPGKAAAAPLATIAQSTSGTTLTVGAGEAYWFTDGNTRTDPDILLINGVERTVASIPTAGNGDTINLTVPITVSSGDSVWLAKYGASPDVGMLLVDEEPPPAVIATPVVLNTVTGTTAAISITSDTLSPPANSLLVVEITANNSTSGALVTPMNISDTFADTLTWTKYEINRGSGAGVGNALFVAQLDATPGSGTVTVTFANNASNKVLTTMHIASGHDTTTPVAQSKTLSGNNVTPFTLAFDGTPDPTSLVLASIATRGTTGPYTFTPGTGFTELAETQPSTGHGQQIQYDYESAAAAVTWTGSFGGSGIAAVAIEIAAAETVVPFTATGSPTFPPLTAVGIADVSDPIYAGSATVTVPALSATGDALFDAGTYSATGTPALPALDATGSATHSDPVYAAVGAPSLAALTAIGIADVDDPLFAAVGVGTLLALDATGDASFDAGTFSAAAAPELPNLTAAGNALFDAGTFTGAGTGTLGALVATGTADPVDPLFSASAAVSLAALDAGGFAEYNDVAFAANGAASLAAFSATGSATHEAPVFAATSASVLSGLDANGTAMHEAPVFSAIGSVTLGSLSADGSGAFNTIILTATGAATLPALDAAGIATHTAPVFAATGALSLSALDSDGQAQSSVPVYSGSGAATLGSFSASGSASFDAGIFTSSGAGQLHALDATGDATHVAPIFVSSGASTLPLLTGSGSATYLAPIRTASGTLLLSVVTASGVASYAPLSQAASNMVLPALTGEGVGVISPPLPARFVSRAIVQI